MTTPDPATAQRYAARHLRRGWLCLLVFLAAGLALESLHGLKVAAYLDLDQAVRRHMWTLAHAHGALLGLVHLGLATTVRANPSLATCSHGHVASVSLDLASLLLPLGFFLGGLWHYAGDPGLAVLLVPVGGALLVVAALLVLLGLRSAPEA
ncbi:hypothetical protein [Nannocystis punicea]|uniref:Uncharacterized protein n=1 Tax=Nannocystis punicea TaxID=2995304 RepID=A0ABY7H7A5_9BACT|nr:hypothetical protein [Nannocystis poenicansa]WAS95159.1 hypothetical protein O0S08_03270 [Nannocystis poenicansa]